jgi:Sec-independent protein translocase protein TatA
MEGIIKAIGWPHLAFLFAVFFVLLFRKPLFGLISRITSIDKSGIKASQTPEAQREEQKKESVQQLLLAIGDSIVLQDIEGRIRADLKEKGLEIDGDTIKVLIKHLAGTRVLLEFEQIHNLIFGSQIFLLKKLNEVAGQGKPIEFVANHFEHVKGFFPEQLGDWSLEQYLAFLIGRLLITTKGNIFHITNLGVEYLTWMIRNGKREDNPL